ncbi:MAG: CvpA family protein [Deltaproteobacteria bacterium]|nr:CvpA family protein [Deltaproteobacteria bacterium]
MNDVPFIDLAVATVLAIAISRGIWIGLIREGFSIAAIAAATIVTRFAVDPLSIRLTELTAGEISGRAAVWIAGAVLVVATILVVGALARLLRRGAKFAGLGWADRIGGGALGLAEGAVISTILVLLALWLVGPAHPTLAGSRSLAIVEQLQTLNDADALPAVTAPGPWR